jgi:hypothetical protein
MQKRQRQMIAKKSKKGSNLRLSNQMQLNSDLKSVVLEQEKSHYEKQASDPRHCLNVFERNQQWLAKKEEKQEQRRLRTLMQRQA